MNLPEMIGPESEVTGKPHCPDFAYSEIKYDLCVWWESEEIDGVTEWYCSCPDWDYRTCETEGKHTLDGRTWEELSEVGVGRGPCGSSQY